MLVFTDRKADAEIQKRQLGAKAAMDLDDMSDEEHEELDLPASPVQRLRKNTRRPLLLVTCGHVTDRLTDCLTDCL